MSTTARMPYVRIIATHSNAMIFRASSIRRPRETSHGYSILCLLHCSRRPSHDTISLPGEFPACKKIRVGCFRGRLRGRKVSGPGAIDFLAPGPRIEPSWERDPHPLRWRMQCPPIPIDSTALYCFGSHSPLFTPAFCLAPPGLPLYKSGLSDRARALVAFGRISGRPSRAPNTSPAHSPSLCDDAEMLALRVVAGVIGSSRYITAVNAL
jgi:hypothetical protein